MKVSVITPTYQREKYLPALYSVFKQQTYPHLELLVSDDSPQPSAFFCALKDERVRYFHSPERRTGAAKRNDLIEQATGSIIVHFDDDDYYAPDYVRTMVENLGEADLVSLGGWYAWSVGARAFGYWDCTCRHHFHYHMSKASLVLEASKDYFPDFVQKHLDGYGFTYVYRKALLDVVKWQPLRHASDYRFVSDLRAAGKKIKHIPDESGLAVHVIHESNTSSCFPQYLLPRFLAERLFPGFGAYLKAVGV